MLQTRLEVGAALVDGRLAAPEPLARATPYVQHEGKWPAFLNGAPNLGGQGWGPHLVVLCILANVILIAVAIAIAVVSMVTRFAAARPPRGPEAPRRAQGEGPQAGKAPEADAAQLGGASLIEDLAAEAMCTGRVH
mmetsp:Transcript_39282/g.121229  ORF Transcript_39282/g.121229 Transcript_39282/m.121229 type:complete len:136 (+) Transcript_39282:179-586(+)